MNFSDISSVITLSIISLINVEVKMTGFITDFVSTTLSAGIVVYGIIRFYFEKRIIITLTDKQTIVDKQRNAFDEYLNLLSIRIAGKCFEHPNWELEFAKASKEVLMWCNNDVVKALSLYTESIYSDDEKESLLADAILRFRKSIGYKNWFWNRINSKNIVTIYRAGNSTAEEFNKQQK